jgi:hypothetical protein
MSSFLRVQTGSHGTIESSVFGMAAFMEIRLLTVMQLDGCHAIPRTTNLDPSRMAFFKMTLRRGSLLLLIGITLLAAGLVLYAGRVRASATALIHSAAEIHSTVDAEREIAAWRNRSARIFLEEVSPTNGDHSYDIHVENGLLHRLRLAPPTMVGMTVTMRDSELRYVILTMFTGRDPATTAGVWVQEWFGSGTVSDLRVNAKDRPMKATVEFSSAVPDTDRQKAFALNTKCFAQLGRCKSAEDILPAVWQLSAKKQP